MNGYESQIDSQNQNSKPAVGNKSSQSTDLQDTVVEMKFLAQSWLDDFEKDIFEGKTLNELMGQGKHV